MGLKNPKYYLDSNAWIALNSKPVALEKVRLLLPNGAFTIHLAFQNVAELLDPINVPEEHRYENEKLLKSLGTEVRPDTIFVLDASALDHARLGQPDSVDILARHVLGKFDSINHLRDGIHLVNSKDANATLITCDSQLRKSATRAQLEVMCTWEWFRELQLEEALDCLSCRG